MNKEQLKAAKQAMIEWLEYPTELGKKPAKIECAGEFDLHDMHYYIFKYKKNALGKWLIGVCGGYEEDELEHCGHVFSEMQEFDEQNAVEQATALVEYLRQYMMDLAKKAEERKGEAGTFVNYVLLEEAKWDKETLLRDLKEAWGIEDNGEESDEEGSTESDDTFVLSYNGAQIAVSLMPAPIPNDEAAYMATNNFMWQNGVEQAKKHTAHIIVAVIGKKLAPKDAGTLLVKVITSACKQEGVLGIYTGDTVLSPEYYMDLSKMLDEGEFPIFNLVWFGLYNDKKGLCAYTSGMRNFGYDEMEVLNSNAEPGKLYDFLADIAHYVITADVVLKDGETIGFSEEQRLPITKSQGVAVEGDSLKIEY